LEVGDHNSPYPSGWVNRDANIKVEKYYKIKFVVSGDFIEEVVLKM
jgi:hypothetical protein